MVRNAKRKAQEKSRCDNIGVAQSPKLSNSETCIILTRISAVAIAKNVNIPFWQSNLPRTVAA
jgi:hypothetical protein